MNKREELIAAQRRKALASSAYFISKKGRSEGLNGPLSEEFREANKALQLLIVRNATELDRIEAENSVGENI